MKALDSGIRKAMQKTASRNNNYFVVRGFRIIPPTPDLPVEELDNSEAAQLRRKCERILERSPLPVDWARYFFFEDTNVASTLRAFDSARRLSASIAVFKDPSCSGPWADTKVIGVFPEEPN